MPRAQYQQWVPIFHGIRLNCEIRIDGRGSHFDPSLLDACRAIVRELLDTYSGMDGRKSRERLEPMTENYFKRDAGDLLT